MKTAPVQYTTSISIPLFGVQVWAITESAPAIQGLGDALKIIVLGSVHAGVAVAVGNRVAVGVGGAVAVGVGGILVAVAVGSGVGVAVGVRKDDPTTLANS